MVAFYDNRPRILVRIILISQNSFVYLKFSKLRLQIFHTVLHKIDDHFETVLSTQKYYVQ